LAAVVRQDVLVRVRVRLRLRLRVRLRLRLRLRVRVRVRVSSCARITQGTTSVISPKSIEPAVRSACRI